MNTRAAVPVLALFGLTLPSLLPAALNAQEPPPPPPPVNETVEVELVVAEGVENREPVGVAEQFPADVGEVYAWMRVDGADGEALEVHWKHGPHEDAVPLEIGGPSWRTWSSKAIPADWTGEWTVEVRDEQGSVLASRTFIVG